MPKNIEEQIKIYRDHLETMKSGSTKEKVELAEKFDTETEYELDNNEQLSKQLSIGDNKVMIKAPALDDIDPKEFTDKREENEEIAKEHVKEKLERRILLDHLIQKYKKEVEKFLKTEMKKKTKLEEKIDKTDELKDTIEDILNERNASRLLEEKLNEFFDDFDSGPFPSKKIASKYDDGKQYFMDEGPEAILEIIQTIKSSGKNTAYLDSYRKLYELKSKALETKKALEKAMKTQEELETELEIEKKDNTKLYIIDLDNKINEQKEELENLEESFKETLKGGYEELEEIQKNYEGAISYVDSNSQKTTNLMENLYNDKIELSKKSNEFLEQQTLKKEEEGIKDSYKRKMGGIKEDAKIGFLNLYGKDSTWINPILKKLSKNFKNFCEEYEKQTIGSTESYLDTSLEIDPQKPARTSIPGVLWNDFVTNAKSYLAALNYLQNSIEFEKKTTFAPIVMPIRKINSTIRTIMNPLTVPKGIIGLAKKLFEEGEKTIEKTLKTKEEILEEIDRKEEETLSMEEKEEEFDTAFDKSFESVEQEKMTEMEESVEQDQSKKRERKRKM